MFRICSIIFLLLFGSFASAGPSGVVRVIDGDTLDVGGQRVRLFGIDAPEIGQPCQDPSNGAQWDCGDWVRQAVAHWAEGQLADCTALDTDRYGRTVARCFVDGQDLGTLIVAQGMGFAYLAYSHDYAADQAAAARAKRGLWALDIAEPAAYRAQERAPVAVTVPASCAIKGNISSGGRIYHAPGQRDYENTRIDTAKGERWFCAPAEAEAAGWRAASR